MKISNREGYFRFTFEEPIVASLQISKIDDCAVETSVGEGKIIDINPEGMKLYTVLNIPETDHKTIELSISFEVNGTAMHVDGVIVWKHGLYYGIDLWQMKQ